MGFPVDRRLYLFLGQSGPQFALQPSSACASNVSANGCWRAGPLGHMKPLCSPSFPRCFLGSVAALLEPFLGSIFGVLEVIALDCKIARFLFDLLFLKAARFGLIFLGTFPVKLDGIFDTGLVISTFLKVFGRFGTSLNLKRHIKSFRRRRAFVFMMILMLLLLSYLVW